MILQRSLSAAALVALAACSDQVFVTDVAFRVTSVSPSPGASGADRGAPVVVTFSEDLVEASVTDPAAFKVERLAADGKPSLVAGKYTYGKVGEAPYAATFTPTVAADDTRALPYSTTIRVSLATTITRKRDGSVLATPVTFEFRTEDPPPLAITRLQPNDGFSGFGRTGTVALTFSEPIDCSAFASTGIVTLRERHDAHPHWAVTGEPAEGRAVDGTWTCPTMPSGDRRRLEGSCTSSTDGDTTDYCTVTFHYAADDATDPAQKLSKSLGFSSNLELSIPGADGGTPELGTLVHSVRATRVTSGATTRLFGALAQGVKVSGRVADPAPLALAATSPRQGDIVAAGADRATNVKLQFTEQVDCARLQDAVKIEETFDRRVVADRDLASGKRTVTGKWSCATATPDREKFACGADGAGCTYTFTPDVPNGQATPFTYSSSVSITLSGGTWAAATPRVESARATSLGGQLPADATVTFRIADPNAFGLAASVPAPLGTGAPRDTSIGFTFTEPPDCAALSAGTTIEETLDAAFGGAKSTVAGSWTCPTIPAEDPAHPDANYTCTGAGNCTAVFKPNTPLRWSSTVSVKLEGGPATANGPAVVHSARVTGRSGSLPDDVAWTFRVADPPALALVTASPTHGASDAARNTSISLSFSEPVDCTKLRAIATVTEAKDAANGGLEGPVAGTWACTTRADETSVNFGTVFACGTPDACVATFTPADPFEYSSRVTVTLPGSTFPGDAIVSTRATSRGGRFANAVRLSFDVEHPPALVLVAATPGGGSSGVAPDTSLVLDFDPASGGVACDSLVPCTGSNAATCTLRVEEVADPLVGHTAIGNESARVKTLRPGTVDCTDGESQVTVDFADFSLSSDVQVTLVGGAAGKALSSAIATSKGGQLPVDVSWKFNVRAPAPFSLVSTAPSASAVGVAGATTVAATFSRALDCATAVDGTSFVVQHRSPALADGTAQGTFAHTQGTLACSGATLTFTPAAPFEPSTEVELSLGKASVATTLRATDATTLGGFFPGPVTSTFRIADPLPLVVVGATPAGSPATNVSATSDVRFTFDRAVRCSTAISRVTVHDDTANTDVAGTVLCSNGTTTGVNVTGVTVIFMPSAPLAVTHVFTAAIGAGVEAATATKVGSTNYGVLPQIFRSTFTVTQEDLRVAATSPVGSSTGITVGSNLAFTFNQDVTASTLKPCAAGGATPADCNLWIAPLATPTKANAIALAAAGYNNGTFTATFDPADGAFAPDLKTNTSYFVHLDAGTTGPQGANGVSKLLQAYEFSFTTATNSLVSSTLPVEGASAQPPTTPVCVDFLAAVNAASLTASGTNQITLTWTDAVGRTAAVPLQATPYTRSNSRGLTNNVVCLNIEPSPSPWVKGLTRLLYSTAYTIRVSTAVDVGGGHLSTPFTASFTTGGPPAIAAISKRNQVVSEALTANETQSPFNAAFTVQFAEDMAPSGFTGTNFGVVTMPGLVAVTGTITLDDAVKPRAATVSGLTLAPDTTYALRIYGGTAGIATADGRPLGDDTLVPFRTNPQATLAIQTLGANIYAGTVLPIVASRDLYLPSVNSNTIYGRRATVRIPGIVAQQPLQPRSVSYLPVPTWLDTAGPYDVQATDAVLDYRGTPIVPTSLGNLTGQGTSSLASHPPTTATCSGTCAVAPGPGPTPQDHTFVFTIPGTTFDARMQPSSYYATPAASALDGTISLETTGTGTGCGTGGKKLAIKVEPVIGGAAADSVRVTITGPDYPKAGCGYALKIRQALTANLFDLAPAVTTCTGNSVTPTDVISSTTCNTVSNPQPGILYTGESTAPTLSSAEVQALSTLAYGAAGATAGTIDVYGATPVRLRFSEPVLASSVTSTTVSLRAGSVGGTAVNLTYAVSGDTVVATPATHLAANTEYFVVVNGVSDLAGNTSASTSRTFKTENAAPTTPGAAAAPTATRAAPFGVATFTFGEPVDPATLTGNAQAGVGSVSLRAGTTNLFGALAVDATNPRLVTWAPAAAIASGTSVTVDLNAAAASVKLTDQTGALLPTSSVNFPW